VPLEFGLGISIGEAAALTSALTWSGTTLLIRSQSERLSAVTINLLRSGTAAVLVLLYLPLMRPHGFSSGLSAHAVVLLLLSGLKSPGLGDTLFFISMRLIGVARAMPLASTNPIWAAILATWLLGEAVTARMAIGIVLVVLAVFLVVSRPRGTASTRHLLRGALLALSAAMLWGAGAVVVKPALEETDLILANAIRLPATALMIGAFGLASGRLNKRSELTWRTVPLLLVSGLVTSFSALLFLFAVQQAGAAKTATLSATSPLFTAPLAALIYREPLTWRVLAGTITSVVGILLVVGT
jgi:drug/metabolite transporter (DMT)-like permease